MKAYHYGERGPGLIDLIGNYARNNKWFIWPAILLLLLIRVIFGPPIWLLVMIGELGHTFAGALGFDSREW